MYPSPPARWGVWEFDTLRRATRRSTAQLTAIRACRRKGAGDSVSVVSLAGGVICPKEKRCVHARIKSTVVRAVSLRAQHFVDGHFFSREHTLRTARTAAPNDAVNIAPKKKTGDGKWIVQWITRWQCFSFCKFSVVRLSACVCVPVRPAVRVCVNECVRVDCFSVWCLIKF